MPMFSPPPVGKQTKKWSGGLLIAIILGVLVDNTITMVNNHFSPYHDNEAESTHGLYEFSLRITSRTCWWSLSISLWNTLYITQVSFTVLWDVTLCSLVSRYTCFIATCCIPFLCHVKFSMFSSLFYPEDKANSLLQSTGIHLPNYTASHPRVP
jgi:hypothetical protein